MRLRKELNAKDQLWLPRLRYENGLSLVEAFV